MKIALSLVAASTTLILCGHASADYTFATFTFDQDETPDQLAFLGDSALLGGAQFSAGNVTRITRSVGFVTVSGDANSGFVEEAGFDSSLSLGRQAFDTSGGAVSQSDGTSSVTSSAVNMPNGNNGDSTRHGLSLSWSGGRALENGAGDDFVLYESGSTPTSPEGMMVRVGLSDGSFSDWYFEEHDAFELYSDSGAGGAGGFAIGFDLTDLGVADDELVTTIQIANLVAADTILGGDASAGFVAFDGSGLDHGFGSGARDPDPLYLGVLGNVIPNPGVLALLGVAGLAGSRRRRNL